MDISQAFAIAVERHQAGDLVAAESQYRAILSQAPNHAATLCNLGTLLSTKNNFAEAAKCYSLCLAASPGYADAHYNFGNLYRRVGQLPEAVREYRACIQSKSDHAGACFNLGLALASLSDLTAAGESFQRVIALEPSYADAHGRLGDVHLRAGRADLALESFRRYSEMKPGDHRGFHNVGLALVNLGFADEAAAQLKKALEIKPDYPDAFNTLGLAYDLMSRKDDAEDCYRKAVSFNPQFADAWSNLGTNLTEAGRSDEAIEALRKSVAAKPAAAQIHSNFVLTLNYTSRLTPFEVLNEHKSWAAKFVPAAPLKALISDPHPDRVLNIGYLSADFRGHTVAGFIEQLLTNHDRKSFHVTAYANLPQPDETTERMKTQADRFRTIIGLSDSEASELIRSDYIDILIDLSGHTAGNRLELLGLKPAPLQMTLFGYPNTTGLAAVDYRITDSIAEPLGLTEDYYVEQLLRLDGPAWIFKPQENAPPVAALPALCNPSLTFGCLNNPAKISEKCLETWAKLLAAIPESRLILLAGQSARGAARLTERFESVGVHRDRLELVFRLPSKDYFDAYSRMDLTLDPFPYNGGVTTCDSLWMGVPVLTVAGDSYVSRQGASILTHAGISEFIAENPEHLIELAKIWATNKEWLADIRKGLRTQVAKSAIADGKTYVKSLETALRSAWMQLLNS